MKKVILITSLFFLLASCNRGENTGNPRFVAMSFLKAISKKDFEGAKKLSTTQTASVIDFMKNFAGKGSLPIQSDQEFDTTKLIFGTAKINGDQATVEISPKGEEAFSQTINLKKENGEWKVDLDILSMMQQGMEKMKQHGMNMNKMMDTSMNKMNDVMDSSHSMMNSDTTH